MPEFQTDWFTARDKGLRILWEIPLAAQPSKIKIPFDDVLKNLNRIKLTKYKGKSEHI